MAKDITINGTQVIWTENGIKQTAISPKFSVYSALDKNNNIKYSAVNFVVTPKIIGDDLSYVTDGKRFDFTINADKILEYVGPEVATVVSDAFKELFVKGLIEKLNSGEI